MIGRAKWYQPQAAPCGLGLMGKRISPWRRSRAYQHAMEIGLSGPDAYDLVQSMADMYERDRPFEAQARALEWVDMTGHFRLMAALLADPEPHWMEAAKQQENWPPPDHPRYVRLASKLKKAARGSE